MAASDVFLQCLLWRIILPFLIIYITVRIFKPSFRDIYLKIYALALHRIALGMEKKLGKKKQQLFTELHDMASGTLTMSQSSNTKPFTLLEIGAGSGANFKYYPTGTQVICMDPNPHFESYLKSNADKFPHIVMKDFVVGYAEDMEDVPSNSVDAVVCTLVLCSVNDIVACLKEVHRVLKPGGKFFFMEHVAAERKSFTFWLQRKLDPAWKIISDGCSFAQETWGFIEHVGFREVKHEKFFVNIHTISGKLMWPYIVRYMLCGMAVK